MEVEHSGEAPMSGPPQVNTQEEVLPGPTFTYSPLASDEFNDFVKKTFFSNDNNSNADNSMKTSKPNHGNRKRVSLTSVEEMHIAAVQANKNQ